MIPSPRSLTTYLTHRAQRGKAATEAMEPYTSGPDDHAGRRAVMALTRCEGYEEDKKSASEFARSLRAISTIAVQSSFKPKRWITMLGSASTNIHRLGFFQRPEI